MSDLIDRQAALDAFGLLYEIQRELEDLPSAYVEPCECNDTISRQEVIRAIYDNTDRLEIAKAVRKLPHVKPQEPKTGHWIDEFGGCTCSECGYLEAGYSDYCPNCGARMVEPQERSGEE